jgi:hypothetical protein
MHTHHSFSAASELISKPINNTWTIFIFHKRKKTISQAACQNYDDINTNISTEEMGSGFILGVDCARLLISMRDCASFAIFPGWHNPG